MFLDTRPNFPMSPLMIFVFKGQADVAALRQAFNETLQYEPLFCSVVTKINGRWCWTQTPKLPEMQCSEIKIANCESGSAENVFFDLQQQTGVCCIYRETENGFVIELSVHHSICDGMGTMRFFGNWLARYAQLVGDTQDIETHYPKPERIRDRENLHIELPHPISKWTTAKSSIKYAGQWFLKRPARLCALPETKSDDKTTSKTINKTAMCFWQQLPEEFTVAYSNAAMRSNVTVNTLFLANYYNVLYDWFVNCYGLISPKTMFRVLVPTNLRKEEHQDIPAANILGYVFLDYYANDCRDTEMLCADLQNRITFVKNWSVGAVFLSGTEFVRKIPFGLRFAASSLFCHSTSVFSNIGSPCRYLLQKQFRNTETIQVGDVQLIQILGSPPVRPHTPFSTGLIQQNNQWTLTVSADGQIMNENNTRTFLSMLIARFKTTAEIEH